MTPWTSWHLHVGTFSPPLMDRLITEVVAPAVPSTPWFYVRYWNRGPHVRLRLRDAVAGMDLHAKLEQFLPSTPFELDADGYRNLVAKVAEIDRTDTALPGAFREPGLYRETYRPETDRYGGTTEMALSEELFWHSSRTALPVVAAIGRGEVSRRSAAVQAFAAGLSVLRDPARMFRYLEHSRRNWPASAGGDLDAAGAHVTALAGSPFVERLLAGRSAAVWQPWTRPLRTALSRWTADHRGGVLATPPEALLASHLHMMSNRLGISLNEELRLISLLHAVLAESL